MTITWTKNHPEADYSSYSGIDSEGNVYTRTANGEVYTVTTPDGRKACGWTADEALKSALSMPILAAALTNAELDQAIAGADTARESAWAAQSAVTTADGYNFRSVNAVANQALEAELVYRDLCAEREQREITRADLGRLIGEIRAYPMEWSKTGPWTYAVSGSNRVHRADRLVDFCRNHNMPYQLSYSDGQVEVAFWRNHISSLATAASGRS